MAAPVAGTYTRYNAEGLREDLADVIYNISPEDTPFLSGIGRETAKQTLHEWQTDSLAAPDTGNALPDGFEADFATPTPTVRVGNRTQISGKTVAISGTLEAVDKAGRRSELAYQIAKKGAELKRDMEAILLSNQGSSDGSFGVPRTLAGLGAWVKTNTDHAGDGADPAYVSGVPSAGRTDGTPRAFTEDILKGVAQSVWSTGGTLKVLMVGPYNKTVVSGFNGIADHVVNISNPGAVTGIVAAVDVYTSDFGTLRIVPNRFQRERDGWFLDFDLLKLATLRNFRTEKLAKTGDADKRMLLVEYTLRVNQEAGLGLAADLTDSAP